MTTSILAVLAFLLVLPYAFPPVYQFPAEKPFSGPRLYNPYVSAHGPWRRANLHAHGRAWLGLANGRQSDAEVVAAYRGLGYDLAGLSNYQKLKGPADGALSIYEHGFNLGKHHQLVFGARRVDWFDCRSGRASTRSSTSSIASDGPPTLLASPIRPLSEATAIRLRICDV